MNSGRRSARQEEELHIQRRNAQLRRQEQWNSNAAYFKTWDLRNNKYASWTSNQYFQKSEEARVEAEKEEKKQQTLMERRDKLRSILDQENEMYKDEVRRLSRPGRAGWMPLEDLKSVNLEMKRRSEEARKREAELLLYQRWKQEQPTLRDLERRQHLEFMKKSWIDQVKEKEKVRERQKAEDALRVKEEEIKRREEEELEKLNQRRKEEEVAELKHQIKLQMEAVRESNKKYRELEKLEAEQMKLKNELEEIVIQRKLAEEKQANKHLVAFWTKQYSLKLQKRSKEMEEEIEMDEKVLQKMKEELCRETEAKLQARDIARTEMELTLRELQAQRQREQLRQKEYEFLFSEEAKRKWELQERIWAQERLARDNLMKEVFDTVNKQVEEKLRRKSTEKAEALKTREELLKRISWLTDQCERTNEDKREARRQFCRDLDLQVTEQIIEKVRKSQEEAEEERKRAQFEKEAEEKLIFEMEKMHVDSMSNVSKPRDFRRQRVVW